MSSDKWKSLYAPGKANHPGINEIMTFLPESVGLLFQEFSKRLARDYDVGCKPPVYTKTDGWVYSFGRYDILLFNHVSMEDGAFSVQGNRVCDEASLSKALELADSLYGGYRERFDKAVVIKKEKQKENTKKRLERERNELEVLYATIDKERFNRFRWSPKLSRQKLKRLYDNDAKNIRDEELLDDVGFTLFARCLQGRDEGALKNNGQLKCHNCREILQAKSRDMLMECPCGQQYIFKDYMRSFRKNNMPSGAATHIFNAFIDDWQRVKGYSTKMALVDKLVHEFHINLNSGVKGRFVGINLIEGTKKQIGDLINELAYGGNTEN